MWFVIQKWTKRKGFEMSGKIKVFLSYADEDLMSAKKITQELKNNGIDVWVGDEASCLPPGAKWSSATREAIEDRDYFIALISNNSIKQKGYWHKEMSMALDILEEYPENRIFFIPVKLENCKPSGRVDYKRIKVC